MDLIEQLFEAAVTEARTVPKMLLLDGELQWRAVGGVMVRLTRSQALSLQHMRLGGAL